MGVHLRTLMEQEDAEVAAAERSGPEQAQADRRARTCLVESAAEAHRVAELLMGFARDKRDVLTGEALVFGCDTEVGLTAVCACLVAEAVITAAWSLHARSAGRLSWGQVVARERCRERHFKRPAATCTHASS